jgi:hypothetical protein
MPPDEDAPRARLLGDPAGRLLAHRVGDRIDLRDATTLAVEAEVGIDGDADGTDLALIGDPAHLLLAARHDGATKLHLIDPRGPSELAQTTLRGAMQLAAAVGHHAWLTGPSGTGLIDVDRRDLALSPLPLRTPPQAVGTFAGARFVASTAGVIEEWDPIQRIPVRRFRLGRPTVARFVGGNERQVWLVASTEPERIEVIPLVNQGQPTKLELPEPVIAVVPHPSGDALIAIADSGAAWVVDLTGRTPLAAVPDVAIDDAAWLGDGALAIAVRGGGVERVALAGRGRAERPVERPSSARRPAPTVRARVEANPAWRDALVDWYRGGATDRPPLPDAGPLPEVAARLELGDELTPALALLYAAYLDGHDGVSAAALARLLDGGWAEALGQGELAASGAARWRRAKVGLTAPVRAALDEAEPRLGALVASDAAPPPGRVAVIATGEDLPALAAWLAPQYGPLLVANPRGAAHLGRFAVEARLRGAAPLLVAPTDAPLPNPAVVVVADEAAARALGIPVIGTWP